MNASIRRKGIEEMKRKKSLLVLIVALAMIVGLGHGCSQHTPQHTSAPDHSASPLGDQGKASVPHVPAHYDTAPPAAELKPVLAASQFSGRTREAYAAVKNIPETIAQMPCYCHCDRGMGHKSLHSCFVDDHAAHCATCVDEALMAYRLEKEGLTAPQIRDRIVAEYSRQ